MISEIIIDFLIILLIENLNVVPTFTFEIN